MYFPAREPEIKCTHCYDTGVCIVEVENQVKMLMACDCKTPCDWHLAKRTTQPRLDFPFKWFRGDVLQKAEQWKAKIKVAEEFWSHQELADAAL